MTLGGRTGLVTLGLVALLALSLWLLASPWEVPVAVVIVLLTVFVAARDAHPERPRAEAPALQDPGVAPILDRLVEGVLLLDAHQTVRFANIAVAAIFDRPRDAMLDVSLIRATREAELARVAREADGVVHEITLDAGLTLRVTGLALPDGRTVVTVLDRTAQRRAERARQDLIANISHELRTPITAARALAETLEDGVPDEAQRVRFHRQLSGEIDRMQGIVERLIRLSRIEQGDEPFAVAPVMPGRLIHEAIERVNPAAVRAGIVLAGETASSVASALVIADEERILEVLTNLLDNAIKFSKPGDTVTVGADNRPGFVEFSVHDEGAGIMPNERLRVFERFYTSDRARTAGLATGTGLGLSIARQIVTRHGGEIWVADDEARGAKICFTIPLAPAGTPSVASQSAP
ncbi:MAG: hypothetical protein EPO65_06205 [Dehalococcoidia bacterium]|nr:MAG: hypothetical protein EPO65_06205 [Dehalococcoidia bacterium]